MSNVCKRCLILVTLFGPKFCRTSSDMHGFMASVWVHLLNSPKASAEHHD